MADHWLYLDAYDNPLAREREEQLYPMSTANWGDVVTRSYRGSECFKCGSFVPVANYTQHNNFHKTFSNRIGEDMSNVSWCDYGNHAFKKGVPGSSNFTANVTGEDGSMQTQNLDACPDHNPLRAQPQFIAKELEAQYPTTAPTNAVSDYSDSYPRDEVPPTTNAGW